MRVRPDDQYRPHRRPPRLDWGDAVAALMVVIIVVLMFVAAQTELSL